MSLPGGGRLRNAAPVQATIVRWYPTWLYRVSLRSDAALSSRLFTVNGLRGFELRLKFTLSHVVYVLLEYLRNNRHQRIFIDTVYPDKFYEEVID